MRQTLLVARRELRQRVLSRGFVLTSIATPLILIVVWALTGAFGTSQGSPAQVEMPRQIAGTVGYVDQAGLIRRIPEVVPPGMLQAFADPQAAEAALRAGQIEAYYVIAPDYRDTGQVRRVSLRLSATPADPQWMSWLLAGNLVPDADAAQLMRLRYPFNAVEPRFVALSTTDGAEGSGNQMLPFVVTMAVMAPLLTGGSLLLGSLAQEKGSRVMEILLVSLRPRQLLAGKLLGLGAVIAIQYAAWALIGALAITVTGRDVVRFLSQVNLSGGELVLVAAFALSGFALYAGLMAGVGALARDMHSSRGWVFMVSLPMLIPVYLWMGITSAPNGALAVGLSLFPFCAPVAMLMRMTSTTVPTWQVGVSLALLALTAAAVIRLMARLFRAHFLLSGEVLSLRRFWAALRS